MTARVAIPWANASRGGPPRTVVPVRPDRLQVFRSLVDREDASGCHLWIGPKNRKGYGLFNTGRTTVHAHRLAYQLAHGSVPEGLCVCHRCDVRACVNPDHLFAGTIEENNRDMALKGRARGPEIQAPRRLKETCRRGHLRTAENARSVHTKGGRRTYSCRVCSRERARAAAELRRLNPRPRAPLPRQVQCRYGHAITGDNIAPSMSGRKRCRACCQRRAREAYNRDPATHNARRRARRNLRKAANIPARFQPVPGRGECQ